MVGQVDIEILLRHASERADGGQRTAFLAIQLVDTIAINDKFALLAAWQIEVVHQTVARVVVGSVTLVVHAGPPGVAIPLAVLARIIPSSDVDASREPVRPRRQRDEAAFWSAAAPMRRVSTRAEFTVRALIRAPHFDSHHDHALNAAAKRPGASALP